MVIKRTTVYLKKCKKHSSAAQRFTKVYFFILLYKSYISLLRWITWSFLALLYVLTVRGKDCCGPHGQLKMGKLHLSLSSRGSGRCLFSEGLPNYSGQFWWEAAPFSMLWMHIDTIMFNFSTCFYFKKVSCHSSLALYKQKCLSNMTQELKKAENKYFSMLDKWQWHIRWCISLFFCFCFFVVIWGVLYIIFGLLASCFFGFGQCPTCSVYVREQSNRCQFGLSLPCMAIFDLLWVPCSVGMDRWLIFSQRTLGWYEERLY